MKKAAPKIKSSTQQFIEIQDIVENIIILKGGYAAMVVEVTASNFALLSKREQDTKIYSYAALLNSLPFPIQILVRNQRVDITSYLKELEAQEQQTKNPLLGSHIRMYREFIHQMIKVNAVLNKSFYIVLSYSSLEAGAVGAAKGVKKGEEQKQYMLDQARKSLQSKADSLMGQIKRVAVSAKVLEQEELVKLFYNVFNQDTLEVALAAKDIQSPMVKTQTIETK